jgi:hypothetical protein
MRSRANRTGTQRLTAGTILGCVLSVGDPGTPRYT